ncbi:MAG: tRNA1(Val) (adenine(37)-N6)-methyltransferase [Lachnospiraceae bacterium]|jgi:tRNA1Val (adenine37-N6)-methyltransferase|nr:tRNA1(Val) (adenine(37)-N6)-methyltransferase [Lachnospiraceae bacterium]
MDNNILKPGERLDDLQNKGYEIIQDDNHFSFGVDAVFLSDFVRVKPKDKVLDLGTGTGILPILIAAKTESKRIVGLEIQETSADMAKRSVLYNHLEDRVEIKVGDIKEASTLFCRETFNVIVTNPPYMKSGHGFSNVSDEKSIARHEILVDLEDICRESSKILPEKGTLFMVHRPFRLTEIIYKMKKYHIEPKRIKFIHSYIDDEPKLVLIEGLKGGNSGVKIEPPVVMYERSNKGKSD